MKFKKTISISNALYRETKKYLTEELPEDKCLSEDETVVLTAQFENGIQMDIKCCGVQYHEGESNLAWTEAVLFDKNGCECCFTEPSDSFTGEWRLEYDGDEYIVNVISDKETFEEKYYKAYQLDWMLSHGFSLQDAYELVIGLMAENVDENPVEAPTSGGDIWLHAERAKESLLYDVGFGSGSVFVCKEEFLNAEFLDREYMEHLFSATHAPEKDRVFWYREYMDSGIPNPDDPYRCAANKLLEVLKEKGREALMAFVGSDAPDTEEELEKAFWTTYSNMPEDKFLQVLNENSIRIWDAAFAIDGRYYCTVWARNQEEAEEAAKDCYYDADFGDLECIDSEFDHIEDDNGNILDPTN